MAVNPHVGGLSPLARGTPAKADAFTNGHRFIPAGAGNSPGHPYTFLTRPVYPRWRGELTITRHYRHWLLGLSPLARGTLIMTHGRPDKVRFIPAGAGNSPVASFPVVSSSVYPRWRGELFPRDCDRHRPIGLSPLARGTLYKRGEFMETVRFIPAGAGNSFYAWQ